MPLLPESPEQLADIVVSAIGPKTRVLSFSRITSPTGLLMPIRLRKQSDRFSVSPTLRVIDKHMLI
jgi:hypothetical protein